MEDGRGWGPFDTKPSFMVLFPATNEASPSGKAAGFDPAIQRFESFRLRKISIPPLGKGKGGEPGFPLTPPGPSRPAMSAFGDSRRVRFFPPSHGVMVSPEQW